MKFTIDYSKWRCGGLGVHKLGKGDTALLNEQKFMCCLGQCESQLGRSDEELFQLGEPNELSTLDNVFNTMNGDLIINASISGQAISINDNNAITNTTRMDMLKDLFSLYGHEIEFINVPN